LGVNPLFAIAQGTMSERLWSIAQNLEFRRFFSSFHHSSTPVLQYSTTVAYWFQLPNRWQVRQQPLEV
jgi:hypothetical protein